MVRKDDQCLEHKISGKDTRSLLRTYEGHKMSGKDTRSLLKGT